jgi:plasmid stabilization system protein ParE
VPGKYQVEITTVAETDVEEIWEYMAQDTIDAANSLVLHLEEQIGRLEIFPLRCPIVPENELLGTDYRHLLYGRYRIIFRIIDSRVIIMRVLHMSRLLDTEML